VDRVREVFASWFPQAPDDEQPTPAPEPEPEPKKETSTGEHPGNRCRCGRGWAFGEGEKCFKCVREEELANSIATDVCAPIDPKEKMWATTNYKFAPPHTITYSLCRCADCGYMATLGPKDVTWSLLGKAPQLHDFVAQDPQGHSPNKRILEHKMNGPVHSQYHSALPDVATQLFPPTPSPMPRTRDKDPEVTPIIGGTRPHRRPKVGYWNPYGEWVPTTLPKKKPTFTHL